MKIRGFEAVIYDQRHQRAEPQLPTRSSASSAGYDFYSPKELTLVPGETFTLFTDVKAYMQSGEVLVLVPRSSLGKKGLVLLNTVGIIDADYYSNEQNDGNIGLMLKNTGTAPLTIAKGDRLVQGIFLPYLLTDDDAAKAERTGGFGSSGL